MPIIDAAGRAPACAAPDEAHAPRVRAHGLAERPAADAAGGREGPRDGGLRGEGPVLVLLAVVLPLHAGDRDALDRAEHEARADRRGDAAMERAALIVPEERADRGRGAERERRDDRDARVLHLEERVEPDARADAPERARHVERGHLAGLTLVARRGRLLRRRAVARRRSVAGRGIAALRRVPLRGRVATLRGRVATLRGRVAACGGG